MFEHHLWQMLGMFGILFLFLGLSLFMKKKVESRLSGDLKIKSVLHLGKKEKLVLAEWGGKEILLGVTSYQINALSSISGHESKNWF